MSDSTDESRDESRDDNAGGQAGSDSAGGAPVPVVGMDLGTSTSAVATLIDGKPELIADRYGDTIIPSVMQVALGNEIVIGSRAKATAVTFHDRTIQEVKRLMGKNESIKLGPRTFTPEEISAEILKYLKATAEARLDQPVTDIVLSVPARFENDAREATRRAAEMAGLNVLRLINEPTAAALSYGLTHLSENQRVLVFDFGGGTLDVTILEMFEGVLDVKTSVGDDQLGGKDIDEILINHFRDVYKEQRGKRMPAPSRDRRAAQVLKEEAENYKKMLSFAESVTVDIPTLTDDGGISTELTREFLESKMEDMLLRAMALCNEALSRARLRWDDIDMVLPVGGSSRIPMFRRALSSLWGRDLDEFDNPDEAVARGAAVAADLELATRRAEEDEARRTLVVLDVSPHRLGVATIKQVGSGQFVGDYFSEIIPKDEKLPARRTRQYVTQFSGDQPIAIRIYEAVSDSNLCREHHLVSELPLRNLTPTSENEQVQVDFRYTLDGTLDVQVSYLAVPSVRVEGQFKVDGTALPMNGEYDDELDEHGLPKGILDAAWRAAPQADMCIPLIEQAERLEKEYPDAAISLRIAASEVKSALLSGEDDEIRRRLDALTDVLFDLTLE